MGPPSQFIEPMKSGLCTPEDEQNWQQLVADVRKGNCALFVGSGCSVPDYGTWKEMVDRVAAEAGQIVPVDLPSRDFPGFLGSCRKAMGEFAYRAVLETILTPVGKEPYRPVHSAMIRTAFASFVTTNYDSSIENADCLVPKVLPEGAVLSYPGDRFEPTRLRSRHLFHVHGRAYDGNGDCLLPRIVVTDKDVEDAHRRPDVASTLLSLLSELCVLFVGFSSDDGVLERVIRDRLGPYEDDLAGSPDPPATIAGDVRYYALRDVCIRSRTVAMTGGRETAPMEMTGVDRREWSAVRTEAVNWFQHPPWALGERVQPILYARREGDQRHAALTSLMNQLQGTPGCGAVSPGGMP